jgi:hypothetical protein
MSARKPSVGSVGSAKHRWQIFNDNYDIASDSERRERSAVANYEKPWAAYRHPMVVNEYFVTHVEALAHAMHDGKVAA